MAPAEILLVAAFDAKNLAYVVPGHPKMVFPGEDAARRAGCIVMPQRPRTGDVQGLSSTELTMQALATLRGRGRSWCPGSLGPFAGPRAPAR